MVILSIVVNTESMKSRELLSTFRLIAEQTRKEKGCLSFTITMGIENENTIHVEQRWKFRSLMENHFRSDLFNALIGAIQVLGQSHEIQIYECSQPEGMEAVKAAQAIIQ